MHEPIIGFRVWRVSLDDKGVGILSPFHKDRWPDGGAPLRAHCSCPGGEIFQNKSCQCGIRLWNSKDLAQKEMANVKHLCVLGEAQGWGKVSLYEKASLVEYARPKNFFPTFGLSDTILSDLATSFNARILLES